MEKRLNELAFGRSEAQRVFRTKLLNINPVLWVNARNRLGPRLVWGMLVLGAFIWGWGLLKNPRDFLDTPSYITTALLLHGMLGVWFATESCKRFAEDRRSGALELLLSTPLTDAEIFRGQRLSLRRQFAGPVVAVLVLDLLFIALGGTWSWRNSPLQGEDFRVYVLVFVSGMAVMIADLLAMTWLGMWAGLTAPTTNRAGGIVIGRVLILPWAAFALICSLLISLLFFRRSNIGPEWFVIGWAVINLLNDLLWYLWSRTQLHTRFRAVATERFDAATGIFARIGRALGRRYGNSRAAAKRGKNPLAIRP